MKKLFRIFLFLFAGMLCFLVALIIFLDIYYSVLDKKLDRITKTIDSRPYKGNFPDVTEPVNTNNGILNLIPVPRKTVLSSGYFKFTDRITYSVSSSLKDKTAEYLKDNLNINPSFLAAGGALQFIYEKSIAEQGYNMEIRPGKISVTYSSLQGLYYAIVTLKVLNHNYSGEIPCASIEDSPDLPVRGVMLDISRNKIPQKETLIKIARMLADLKYNHLELYVEGFSFAYPSFKSLWEAKETPVTGEEIRELDSFCKNHFIDLTANQNSLGHMMAWLGTNEYKDLAECPNGYKLMGLVNMKGTLDPNDPRSIELVTKMTDDLIPNFSSPNVNIDMDEPFELGKGKSKELCKQKGEGQVYMDYALKMHEMLAKRNKKVLMWGDIVLRHPDVIPLIPKDVTLLDWGYEAGYPYERHCRVLQKSGLDYMVCPGTNSWTTITGRTDNMIATIESATSNGVKFGAKGMLLTDWGDMGHWQYLPVSYAGYVTGAALSWNSQSSMVMPLAKFLNSYIFGDKNSVMGNLVLNLGRYNRYEEFPMLNMTTAMIYLQFGLRDRVMVNGIFDKTLKSIGGLMNDIAPELIDTLTKSYNNRHRFDYAGLQNFINQGETSLDKTAMTNDDGQLIKDEYRNALKLIRIGSGIQYFTQARQNMNPDEQRKFLKDIKSLTRNYLDANRRLWLLRDKPGGYDTSVAPLYSLIQQIDDRLNVLDSNAISRFFNRFMERIGTAGAVLYLKSV